MNTAIAAVVRAAAIDVLFAAAPGEPLVRALRVLAFGVLRPLTSVSRADAPC